MNSKHFKRKLFEPYRLSVCRKYFANEVYDSLSHPMPSISHYRKNMAYHFNSRQTKIAERHALRPSFMGVVFGVYGNWIWEFGDLKSNTPILRGSIWPNTIISNPIFFFSPRLHRIWNPNTMESKTIVFAVFDLTCRRVPLKVRSLHQA